MSTSAINRVVGYVRQAALLRQEAEATDGQLLACFLAQRSEAAFAALVRRHGPMVWGVCRRILGTQHDAEDAFQASFLVLVRKAPSIASRELLANWLYGVAHRTALHARTATAKRHLKEKLVSVMPDSATAPPDPWHDVLPILDEELS